MKPETLVGAVGILAIGEIIRQSVFESMLSNFAILNSIELYELLLHRNEIIEQIIYEVYWK